MAAISTRGLTKRYGETVGIVDVTLEVPSGVVFGYLGPNGAGKSTTLRVLVGLLRPTAGSATVLGLDVVDDTDVLRGRVGYLPGDFVAYPDLTGAEFLRFLANLRRVQVTSTVELLAKRLKLDLNRRIGTLSHGNRQKVGLIQAFMHDPELLILDEPTAGLDPLMQQEFLTLVREARDAGRTVVLSSHILDEVQAVADIVGIVRSGRLIDVQTIDALRQQAVRRIDLTFEGPPPAAVLSAAPGVQRVTVEGTTAHIGIDGSTADLLIAAAPHRVVDVAAHEVDLEEIFLTYYANGA